ncbi:CCA tRNA nucleotidyltransferase [Rhodopirellula sp. JC740]|uniref:CCA tRNA nucleotidyltransferase n=1 Tax=Rhodopirellula halodulae TaxID=2894198 RepID=A0ABS8NAZ2_9BACT|nr:CCA tRNA nucleotidyltransferase [Rhodopirellula sp. JC740]MCC9640741.1 CCA tRNA nucleotidyltransferase [Rhodopirellula sp. JC740]
MPDFPPEILDSPEAAEAVRIIQELNRAGFVAVLAGGCVRDALLGRKPKDFDVATDATPESVREVFGKRNTLAFGESFGVIGVLPPRSQRDSASESAAAKLLPTEVATFRADGTYSDGRRPDHVTYGDAEADALRRDFTINGMFYDLSKREVVDYVGGTEDLKKQQLRTIGKAATRFDEDKLRMLRAVRFATTLGFAIERKTFAAIEKHADGISVVSGERIGAEMRRVMMAPNSDFGLETLVDTGLSSHIWPQLQTMNWTEYARAVQQTKHRSFEVAMAIALFHLTDDSVHCLRLLFNDWKLSVAERRAIEAALTHAQMITECDSLPWSRLQPILIDDDAEIIVATARALAPKSRGVARAAKALSGDPDVLNPAPLVTGADLIASGLRPGPEFKAILQSIRDDQLDGKLTDREDALQRLPSYGK